MVSCSLPTQSRRNNGSETNIAVGCVLVYLTPLVLALSNLVIALDKVVDGLLIAVKKILDGVLGGLAAGLLGLLPF